MKRTASLPGLPAIATIGATIATGLYWLCNGVISLGHLFWIPVVPLGFYKTWRCSICTKNPRAHVRTSPGTIVAGMFWTMRLVSISFAVVFAFQLKARLKESPQEKKIEPLADDRCLVCGGSMTDYPKWQCLDCGVVRYGS